MSSTFKTCPSSERSHHTKNPIRAYVEGGIGKANKELSNYPSRPATMVNVSIGDPSVYQDFKPNPECLKMLANSISKDNGYVDFAGIPEIRSFIASQYKSNFKIGAEEVFITQGVSMGLWMSLNVLCDEGDNFLMPKPGFPLIVAMAENRKIQIKYYELDENSEIKKETLCPDEKTKFLLVNNPSNPLGSNWSRQEVQKILDFCEQKNLPIVADETYEQFLFQGEFVSFGELTTKVPILLCSGLSKRYLVPGWRTGWIVLIGPDGVFDEIKQGLKNMFSMLGHSNTIVMKQIPEIVKCNVEFSQKKYKEIGERYALLQEHLSNQRGITLLKADGAMYAVIQVQLEEFKDIKDIESFAIELYKEQNVMALPGSLFVEGNFIRFVLCADNQVSLFNSDNYYSL